MEWNHAVEHIFEGLADESQLRHKLHHQQYRWYTNRNNHYAIPVVVLSVLSGSGNFIAGNFINKTIEKYLIICIGVVSICTSIISSISQFLKLAQLSESNRVASLAWGKFHSCIKFQIQLKSEDRLDAKDFMTTVISEYDRLYEISPPLLARFIDKMCKKLQNLVTDRFRIPHYMNGYHHCSSYHDGFVDNSISDEKQHDD